MRLSVENVQTVVQACLLKDSDPESVGMEVEGIVSKFGFNRAHLHEHIVDIESMLSELPEQFHESTGGGWSFLQACQKRDGSQWTGEHRTMEHLFALGIAAGKAKCLLPREMWFALPGSMPYYVVLDTTPAPGGEEEQIC